MADVLRVSADAFGAAVRESAQAAGGDAVALGAAGAAARAAARAAAEAALAEGTVPLLTQAAAATLPNGALVRFRGLVQDVFNPEYFVGAYSNGGSGTQPGDEWHSLALMEAPLAGYTPPIADDARHHIWERRPFVAVPIPGEADWAGWEESPAQQQQQQVSLPPPGSATKRGRDDDGEGDAMDDADDCIAGDGPAAIDGGGAIPKRGRAAAGGGGEAASCVGRLAGDAASAAGVDASVISRVIIKAYGEADDMRLNEAVEVVGVLVRTPEVQTALSDEADARDPFNAGLDAAHNPPHSQVPRLHGIIMRRMGGAADEVTATLSRANAALAAEAAAAGAAPALRGRVVGALAAALANDTLAAEYALLAMLASVNTRNPIPLGHLAVNINAKAAPAQRVADALLAVARVLLPRVAPFELTVESLNAAPAVPRKDYAADCLVGGPLQLAEETLLLVDETRLVSGKLGPVGVSNLEALKAVAEEQALEYDFEFHKLPVHTNLKMLIVSDGKSLVPAAASVPVRPTNFTGAGGEADVLEAANAAVGAIAAVVGGLDAARAYLAAATQRAALVDIGADAGAAIEADMVAARKADAGLRQEELHGWLVTAKLLAASHGESELSAARWRSFRAMEHTRAERVRAP